MCPLLLFSAGVRLVRLFEKVYTFRKFVRIFIVLTKILPTGLDFVQKKLLLGT